MCWTTLILPQVRPSTAWGKLTTGSLTLSDNAQLDYQFGQAYTPGGAFNDLIDVNGDLTLDGKLNIENLTGRQL